jgi:hypothetical protein
MDDEMVQRCIYCWTVISDLRNSVWLAGQKPPQGYPAGEIFIRAGSPTVIQTEEPQKPEIVVDCRS